MILLQTHKNDKIITFKETTTITLNHLGVILHHNLNHIKPLTQEVRELTVMRVTPITTIVIHRTASSSIIIRAAIKTMVQLKIMMMIPTTNLLGTQSKLASALLKRFL
jgi:hypothetical protein